MNGPSIYKIVGDQLKATVPIQKGQIILVENPIVSISESILTTYDFCQSTEIMRIFENEIDNAKDLELIAMCFMLLSDGDKYKTYNEFVPASDIETNIPNINEYAKILKNIYKLVENIDIGKSVLKTLIRKVARYRFFSTIDIFSCPFKSFLYKTASFLGNQCAGANCDKLISKKFIAVWANRNINIGETLTVSRIDYSDMQNIQDRQKMFRNMYYRSCKCLDCVQCIGPPNVVFPTDIPELKMYMNRLKECENIKECQVIIKVILMKYQKRLIKSPRAIIYMFLLYLQKTDTLKLENYDIESLCLADNIVYHFYEMDKNIFKHVKNLKLSTDTKRKLSVKFAFALLNTQNIKENPKACLYLYFVISKYIYDPPIPQKIKSLHYKFMNYLVQKSQQYRDTHKYLKNNISKLVESGTFAEATRFAFGNKSQKIRKKGS